MFRGSPEADFLSPLQLAQGYWHESQLPAIQTPSCLRQHPPCSCLSSARDLTLGGDTAWPCKPLWVEAGGKTCPARCAPGQTAALSLSSLHCREHHGRKGLENATAGTAARGNVTDREHSAKQCSADTSGWRFGSPRLDTPCCRHFPRLR